MRPSVLKRFWRPQGELGCLLTPLSRYPISIPARMGNEARDSSGRMVAADLLVVVERNGWVEGVVGLFCVERLPRAQEDLQTKR